MEYHVANVNLAKALNSVPVASRGPGGSSPSAIRAGRPWPSRTGTGSGQGWKSSFSNEHHSHLQLIIICSHERSISSVLSSVLLLKIHDKEDLSSRLAKDRRSGRLRDSEIIIDFKILVGVVLHRPELGL